MNSTSNWKEMLDVSDEKRAFSKFAHMIYKDESQEPENNKNSTVSRNAQDHRQHPSRLQLPSNVLTNNAALGNSRNILNAYSPSKQYYQLPHHFSPMSHGNTTMTSSRFQNRGDIENLYHRNASIFTSSGGLIHISLRHGVRIDITVDNSIRLTCCAGQIVISVSNTGDESAVKHPNGLVQQDDKFVRIVANDPSKNSSFTRYANMSDNGITFTSSLLGGGFILDAIGTRQTDEQFPKLTVDVDNISTVFLSKSKHGPACNDEASQLIRKASIKMCTDDEMDVITIHDYRIWQMKDGLVTVARLSFPLKIRASPMNCSFTLSTTHLHCTASSKESAHLFVRCQDQSMHYDGKNFIVRYNGNSAGFDKNDFLIVY